MELRVEIDESLILPVYRHLLDSTADLNFLWGGRDSGKSKFIAQKLIMDCLSLSYFRCILIKKTHESIKDAQWQTIKDTCEEWGISHLFKFNSSPLEIHCINGNKFIARGCDKATKLKSIANPSHAWYEEGNQLSQNDYITASTTLRSSRGEVQEWFSFNPESEGDYMKFWLYNTYFSNHTGANNFSDTVTTTMGNGESFSLRYTSTHTTYHDNPYVSPRRKAVLESLIKIDPYYYQVFTLGNWGNVTNDSPWAYAFNYDDHVGLPVLNRAHELYLSFDFNRNPACCSAIQWYGGKVRVLETIKLQNSGTDGICRYILLHYPNCLYIVTGDYSGNTASSIYEEEVSNYTVIQNVLNLNPGQVQIKPNPKLKKNSLLVNAALAQYPIEVHQTKAYHLIFDFQNVKRLADGTIEKKDRTDEAQQADALDTFRYFVNYYLEELITVPEIK